MGEPFTHPEGGDMIAEVKRRGLHLTIITNWWPPSRSGLSIGGRSAPIRSACGSADDVSRIPSQFVNDERQRRPCWRSFAKPDGV